MLGPWSAKSTQGEGSYGFTIPLTAFPMNPGFAKSALTFLRWQSAKVHQMRTGEGHIGDLVGGIFLFGDDTEELLRPRGSVRKEVIEEDSQDKNEEGDEDTEEVEEMNQEKDREHIEKFRPGQNPQSNMATDRRGWLRHAVQSRQISPRIPRSQIRIASLVGVPDTGFRVQDSGSDRREAPLPVQPRPRPVPRPETAPSSSSRLTIGRTYETATVEYCVVESPHKEGDWIRVQAKVAVNVTVRLKKGLWSKAKVNGKTVRLAVLDQDLPAGEKFHFDPAHVQSLQIGRHGRAQNEVDLDEVMSRLR
jgi:hypothetical protein